MNQSAQMLTALAEARRQFLQTVAGISESDARRRPDDAEWSVIEVLAHMIDVDDCYLGQALAICHMPGIAFTHFDDDAWKRTHPGPDEFDLADVLARLARSHQRILESAAMLTEAELSTPCVHPRRTLP